MKSADEWIAEYEWLERLPGGWDVTHSCCPADPANVAAIQRDVLLCALDRIRGYNSGRGCAEVLATMIAEVRP